mmetsp:Transcript_6295/g.13519  ORF Transcript_6295/g.13519 Transcript_6295/m.13519 type:complete len:225 (+) Transcript_6295:1408-2082(+)
MSHMENPWTQKLFSVHFHRPSFRYSCHLDPESLTLGYAPWSSGSSAKWFTCSRRSLSMASETKVGWDFNWKVTHLAIPLSTKYWARDRSVISSNPALSTMISMLPPPWALSFSKCSTRRDESSCKSPSVALSRMAEKMSWVAVLVSAGHRERSILLPQRAMLAASLVPWSMLSSSLATRLLILPKTPSAEATDETNPARFCLMKGSYKYPGFFPEESRLFSSQY